MSEEIKVETGKGPIVGVVTISVVEDFESRYDDDIDTDVDKTATDKPNACKDSEDVDSEKGRIDAGTEDEEDAPCTADGAEIGFKATLQKHPISNVGGESKPEHQKTHEATPGGTGGSGVDVFSVRRAMSTTERSVIDWRSTAQGADGVAAGNVVMTGVERNGNDVEKEGAEKSPGGDEVAGEERNIGDSLFVSMRVR
ncbi:hypothetical protein FA95DRAFT_371674 [Auriscalpium vulgare]|uniref:Uncharacterized protein n=1 Tax=Auriscalpium vulgare TaxID=40419 RepID=A0ACB8RIP8_9AGAM|nr:hypothetical protein FA95DRAFT_371674 [Auriscalpium vulgare]